MSEIIGPGSYAAIMRRENEGGTPMAQAAIQGGGGNAGIAGGPSGNIDLAQGGQLAQGATQNTDPFNSLMVLAGTEVRKKVEQASIQAYMKGISMQAAGVAADKLEENYVRTGLWDKLVDEKYLQMGYDDSLAYNNIQSLQAKYLNDASIAEKSPQELQAMLTRDMAAMSNSDGVSLRMIQLGTPMLDQVMQKAHMQHHVFLRERLVNERSAASINALDSVKSILENSTPESQGDDAIQIGAIFSSAIQKMEGESEAEWQARTGGMMDHAVASGNPMILKGLRNSGIFNFMPIAQQSKLETAIAGSVNAARVNFAINNDKWIAEMRYKMDAAETFEEREAIMDNVDARFQLQTGAYEESYFKRTASYNDGYTQMAVNLEKRAAYDRQEAQTTFTDNATTEIYTYIANGDYDGAQAARERNVALGQSKQLSTGDIPNPVQIENIRMQDAKDKLRDSRPSAQEVEDARVARNRRLQVDNAINIAARKWPNDLTQAPNARGLVPFDGLKKDQILEVLRTVGPNMTPESMASLLVDIVNDPQQKGEGDEVIEAAQGGLVGEVGHAINTRQFDETKVSNAVELMDLIAAHKGGSGSRTLDEIFGANQVKMVMTYKDKLAQSIARGEKPHKEALWHESWALVYPNSSAMRSTPTRENVEVANAVLKKSNIDVGDLNPHSRQLVQQYLAGHIANSSYSTNQDAYNASSGVVRDNILVEGEFAYVPTPNTLTPGQIVGLSGSQMNNKVFMQAFVELIGTVTQEEDRSRVSWNQVGDSMDDLDGGFQLRYTDKNHNYHTPTISYQAIRDKYREIAERNHTEYITRPPTLEQQRRARRDPDVFDPNDIFAPINPNTAQPQ